MTKVAQHTKGPMRLVTAAEVSANAATRWHEQYKHWTDDDRFADGQSKGELRARLNSEQHTPENITSILNEGWAYPQCDCCGEHVDTVVRFSGEYIDYDKRLLDLCGNCLTRANDLGKAAS